MGHYRRRRGSVLKTHVRMVAERPRWVGCGPSLKDIFGGPIACGGNQTLLRGSQSFEAEGGCAGRSYLSFIDDKPF